ncbi:MAG TPA: hypothetical protein VGW78_00040 [Candidatus Babeliales bacterium]|jgi:hypothetical protein|nr:hypothetical protein [Candidatus Babeliales bacterium]
MNIKIEITGKRPLIRNKIKSYRGKIYIGDYWESIFAALGYWKKRDYERQWKEALERLKTHNSSCLIVSVLNPNVQKYIEMWMLYRVKNTIYIHNRFFILEYYDRLLKGKTLTLDNWHEFIPRKRLNKPGENKWSEWSVPYE